MGGGRAKAGEVSLHKTVLSAVVPVFGTAKVRLAIPASETLLSGGAADAVGFQNVNAAIDHYDTQWSNSNSVAVDNTTMPSIPLRSLRPGWDPCWNGLTPRFI
ncbi:hypothetical protein N7456_001209 [Penicillium angulare]|uniref:Uncharacterized protein n=1 Tax=Penicillium angulare TaxID=116970 RepID=A0A9W9GDK8_9EURO|nr:hypothetical protein N7456_001209 [Penicillium angulare]